jgi:cytochrome c
LEEDVMNRNRRIIAVVNALAVVMGVLAASTVMANEAADVKALVEEGVVMAVVKGEEAALKAIGDPNGPFIKGNLYLFAGPLDKVAMSGHPYKPELVGKDLSTFRDEHGNFLFFEFVKLALEDGAGWTEYWWPKPGATKASLKKTYVMKVPGRDMYIGGGYYPE